MTYIIIKTKIKAKIKAKIKTITNVIFKYSCEIKGIHNLYLQGLSREGKVLPLSTEEKIHELIEYVKEYDNRHIFSTMLSQKEYIEKNYGDQIDDITIVTKGLCGECKTKEE